MLNRMQMEIQFEQLTCLDDAKHCKERVKRFDIAYRHDNLSVSSAAFDIFSQPLNRWIMQLQNYFLECVGDGNEVSLCCHWMLITLHFFSSSSGRVGNNENVEDSQEISCAFFW